ncbi:MAG: response regulator [Rhodospirillales bacterium]
MTDTPHILIVDDHRDIREPLARYLEKNGCRVTEAADAAAARRILKAGAPDLVVLDIMMPGEDGLSLTRDLRAQSSPQRSLPIILLTAVAEDTDRIVGLEMGADDYVTKPFNPRELLARIKTVLRRSRDLPPERDAVENTQYRFAGWAFDAAKRELTDENGVIVPLSTGEFMLLHALVKRPGIVLSRDQLLDLTRGRDAVVFDRSIDNQVSRLRKKIEADPSDPRIIKTHWGGGYSFVAEVTTP